MTECEPLSARLVKSIQDNHAYLEIKKDPYIKDQKQKKYQYWFYFKAKNVLNKNG